jgi:hypothetical protein
MTDDQADTAKIEAVLQQMTEEELLRWCEGTLKAAALGQRVLFERYPVAWARFNASVADGTITLG